jgi:hypothetical protein
MRHLLMDPSFPDIVGEWARCEALDAGGPANDNASGDREQRDAFAELFLLQIARRDIEATRVW